MRWKDGSRRLPLRLFSSLRLEKSLGRACGISSAALLRNQRNLDNEILGAVLSSKTELTAEAAKDLGFDKLRITAERALNSTSAKPGKLIDTTLNLKNY